MAWNEYLSTFFDCYSTTPYSITAHLDEFVDVLLTHVVGDFTVPCHARHICQFIPIILLEEIATNKWVREIEGEEAITYSV